MIRNDLIVFLFRDIRGLNAMWSESRVEVRFHFYSSAIDIIDNRHKPTKESSNNCVHFVLERRERFIKISE